MVQDCVGTCAGVDTAAESAGAAFSAMGITAYLSEGGELYGGKGKPYGGAGVEGGHRKAAPVRRRTVATARPYRRPRVTAGAP
jgi:hypothetical protein